MRGPRDRSGLAPPRLGRARAAAARSIEHVAHGVIDIDTSGTFAGRLVEIDDELGKVIASLAPDAAAVESLFFAKDAQSAAKLGHARGVVLLRLARARRRRSPSTRRRS